MTLIKKWHTEKVKNIVKTAIEKMPEEATNIRLIEGFHQSRGALGTVNCWTEVEAVYKNDEGKEVGREKTIDKHGGWQYSNPANYILYCMGLYQPHNKDQLNSIKQTYEWDLNTKQIYPINEIYSNEYLMDLKVKESIFTTDEVTLTFKLDYESDYWRGANYRIILDDYTTETLREYDAFTLFTDTHNKLVENGVKVNIVWDMKDEDKHKLRTNWRWDIYNISF